MPKIHVPGVSINVVQAGSSQAVYSGGDIPSDSILYFESGLDTTLWSQGTVTTGGATSFTDSTKSLLWTSNEWTGYRARNASANDETGSIIGNSTTVITATLTGAEVWDVDDVYIIEHTTLLTDNTKTWTPNEWVGFRLKIGTSNANTSIGAIEGNTDETITVTSLVGDLDAVEPGQDYKITMAVDVGDIIEYDALTNLGGAVSMSVLGVPSISGASGTHTFNARIIDVSDGNSVSADFLVTVTV